LALGPGTIEAQTPGAVGVVTTLAGEATGARAALPEPAAVTFRDPVYTRDRIATGEKSIVSVLLGGKVGRRSAPSEARLPARSVARRPASPARSAASPEAWPAAGSPADWAAPSVVSAAWWAVPEVPSAGRMAVSPEASSAAESAPPPHPALFPTGRGLGEGDLRVEGAGYNRSVRPLALTFALLAGLAVDAAPVAAQARAPGAVPQGGPRIRDAERERLERLGNEVARATLEYRTSLERLRDMYKKDVESLTELVEVRRDLYRRQIVSLREVEIGERLLAEAQAKVKEAEGWVREADKMIAEATVHSELARMTLAAGGYVATGVFIRFNGTVAFSPAQLPAVERFFSTRFGRALPVSALGQSAAHDRIGFDHRNAVDVALHPDSAEGRALMSYLQRQNIPFVAVRGAVPGSSTGAHIHIGQPSRRFTARP
jgi:hypothetical protein